MGLIYFRFLEYHFTQNPMYYSRIQEKLDSIDFRYKTTLDIISNVFDLL